MMMGACIMRLRGTSPFPPRPNKSSGRASGDQTGHDSNSSRYMPATLRRVSVSPVLKNPPIRAISSAPKLSSPQASPSPGAAAAPRVSRPTPSSLLNGKADLSGELALRIEKAFGVKMDTLMRMQASYDIAQTRKRENQIRVPRVALLTAAH